MTRKELSALERWVSDVVVEVNKAGREWTRTGEVSSRRASRIWAIIANVPGIRDQWRECERRLPAGALEHAESALSRERRSIERRSRE